MPLASPAPIRRVVIGAQNGKPVILTAMNGIFD